MSEIAPGPGDSEDVAAGLAVMSVTSRWGRGSTDRKDGVEESGLSIACVRELPARPAVCGPWPDWLPPDSPVRAAVEGIGVTALWVHQVVAGEALRTGRHVTLTTGTASGKSLAYLLPIAAAALGSVPAAASPTAGPGCVDLPVRPRRRPATSLYLAPTKALAHDQARVCAELAVPGWRVTTVDGDTDPAGRRWARDHAHHVLTNPDLVHASLLPNHARWASFLRSLRYVVVDESHRYRGVFGAQVASVLRRLRRVAAHYGAYPTFAVLSATAPEPVTTAAALTGLPAAELLLVDHDASPRGPVTISLARAVDEPAETAAARELAARVRRGQQVLAFVPSRRGAEEVARAAAAYVRGDRSRAGDGTGAGARVGAGAGAGVGVEAGVGAGVGVGDQAASIVAYRAGYLANDRRVIERGLAAGTVRGVAATNALELGVDIAGLDAVVLCGYPGSRAAFWQQAGRAGRRGAAADVVLIARPHPLDAYLLDHPGALFDEPVESPVLDAASPPVLGPQLAAAAQELPLRPGDERWFGAAMWPIVGRLTDLGLLRRRPDGWYWTSPRRAVDRINLRTADSTSIDIVEEPTGRVLGTVAAAAADLVVHAGAVYVHQGETYLCEDRDDEAREAYVRAARPGYLTQPLADVEIRLGSAVHERSVGGGRLTYGPARVSTTVTGFLRRDERTGQVWDSTELDGEERILATTAAVLTVPTGGLSETGRLRRDAGVHALEHVLGGLLPVIVANDRSDVGTHSWLDEAGAGVITVFDRQLGSGFAVRAYERSDDWLATARDRLAGCRCESGCPACILVAGCSSARPLDKSVARQLLAVLNGSLGTARLGDVSVGERVETGRR